MLSRRSLMFGALAATLAPSSMQFQDVDVIADSALTIGVDHAGGPDTLQVVWMHNNRVIYCYDRGSLEWVNVGAPADFALAT